MIDLSPDAAEAAPLDAFAWPERLPASNGSAAMLPPAAEPSASSGAGSRADAPPAPSPALRLPEVKPPGLVRSEAQLAAALQRAVALGRR